MTVRRLLVLGVCALGVASLYVVPGIARSPQQVAAPRPHDEPTARPSRTAVRDASVPTSPRPEPSSRPTASTTPADEPSADPSPTGTDPEAAPTSEAPRPARTGATAFDPADARDDEAPAPVAAVTSAEVSPSRLTLRWPAAADNVGVVEYKVVLNGFEVARTPETTATVRWFNDDAREQLVQVQAVDAAGNESPSSPALLVARPTPGPTPSPTEPTPEPTEPTPEPSEPTTGPTPAPSAPTPSATDDETRGEAPLGDAEPGPGPADEEN